MKSQVSKIVSDDVDLLWIELRKGSKSGLEGLYRHFSRQLFHHGLSVVPDPDFVQDCIQEVFMDLWKYHKNLQVADNVKLYLYRSLRYKICREDKKEKKWKKEDIDEHLESSCFIESKETELIGAQGEELLQKRLAGAILGLPPRQKEIVQYLFFESFSYEEVSRLMGISIRSVYTLAWKAISNLKKALLAYICLFTFCN